MNKQSAKVRKSKRFSWSKVDPKVTRAMLASAYRSRNQQDALSTLKKASDRSLLLTARGTLGEPPKPAFFDSEMIEVLRTVWMPKADKRDLLELVVQVGAGTGSASQARTIATKRDSVAYLQSRKKTNNYCTNVRKAFIKAHKVGVTVAVGPPSPLGHPAGAVTLEGQANTEARKPYPHQVEAWKRFDELVSAPTGDPFQGCVVLPTGSGKTETAAVWLLEQMEKDPELRVLWVTHQLGLVDQALLRFQSLARSLPTSFAKTARRIHSNGSAISTLSEPDLDMATISIQTLAKVVSKKNNALRRFMERPTVVIVDEAHHAGSASYDTVLDQVCDSKNLRALIGLTATPYPTSPLAKQRFRRRFPGRVIERSAPELINDGIIARPVLHTIDTGVVMQLSAEERRKAEGIDFPPEVLRRLERDERNDLIVQHWKAGAESWGKTLVFALSIDHADALDKAFDEAGVDTRVLHSRSDQSAAELLAWFRKGTQPRVLVSVGMLTEGIDLPDARTAILSRPTVSRILMQQMIGRVLRGPSAGGDTEANIINLRDQWERFGDILDPEEVVERPEIVVTDPDGSLRRLPPVVVDDEGSEIPSDVSAQVARQVDADRRGANLDDDDPRNDRSLDPLLTATSLCGYYELGDRNIAVFEHQRDGYLDLIRDCLGGDLKGRSLLGYFEEEPPPYPRRRSLRELVDLTRETGEAPSFVEIGATIGPEVAVQRIHSAGAITVDERAAIVREAYEQTIARNAYPTLRHFEEKVDAALRDARDRPRHNPEHLVERPSGSKRLPRFDRELGPLVDLALGEARRVLPEHSERLTRELTPQVDWTKRVSKRTFAHWSLDLGGRHPGRQRIRVNRLLRTRPDAVPDEVIAYLIYHELIHHLLPGQGHDAEFYELMDRFPNGIDHDRFLDTLHERWDTRPESYQAASG